VLPMVEGSYKYDLVGEFALKLYTHVEVPPNKPPQYVAQVRADKSRFAGIGVAPTLDHDFYPNSLPAIFEAIEKANAGS